MPILRMWIGGTNVEIMVIMTKAVTSAVVTITGLTFNEKLQTKGFFDFCL